MKIERPFLLIIVCIFASGIFVACEPPDPGPFPPNENFRYIGSFETPYPAFIYEDKARHTDPESNLLMTSFWPVGYQDHVSSIGNLENTVNYMLGVNSTVATAEIETLTTFDDTIHFWPNEFKATLYCFSLSYFRVGRPNAGSLFV